MSDSPLDAAPADGLERAFRLPEYIAEDSELLALHEELSQRMRREAAGLPMGTNQEILLERILTKYLIIKWREENTWAGTGVNGEKDANSQWLDMLKEWNRVLQANDDKMREALLLEVQKITTEAVQLISNEDDRRSVRRHFQEKFAAIGY